MRETNYTYTIESGKLKLIPRKYISSKYYNIKKNNGLLLCYSKEHRNLSYVISKDCTLTGTKVY